MAKAIHAMVRVRDEARSLAFYRTAFGLEVAGRYEFDGFVLIYLSNGETGFEVELTVNKGTTAPYDLGNGYGHLAFSTADLDGDHARLSEAGLEVGEIKTLDHGGTRLARYFFLEDPDGYKIEMLERAGRYQ